MPPLADLPAVLGLVALLVVAYRHAPPRVEAAVAVGATALALAPAALGVAGTPSASAVGDTLAHLAPVVAFLVTILVVGAVCDRAGLFAATGRLLRGGATRVLTVGFLVAAAVTAVLSLDATVVLLTPVVVAAAVGSGVRHRPGAYACLRMANSASLLLPVSNLTNLLALPHLDLGFAGFAAAMAPVLLVVLVIEYAGLRLLFRGELRRPATPTTSDDVPLPVVPVVVVVAMLAGFVATSPLDLDPAWVSGAAAVVLVAWARRRGSDLRDSAIGARDVVRAANPSFALLVLALGVVVAVIADGFLGEAVREVLPGRSSDGSALGFGALLAVAVIATVLANALTNLSATLLLVPLVAPLGEAAVLAALIGLNVGSGLTLSGSLANLLWRRTLAGLDRPETLLGFHRVSLLLTPVALVGAVAALALTT